MASSSISLLLARLREMYGVDRIVPYGTCDDEENGTGFRLRGVDATFSVHSQDGSLPFGTYDVQIESYPPGDYVFANVVSLEELIKLVARVAAYDWPD